ncbi:MAG TPA: PGDYG domain-containing protein [Steroidobacteraceae bacterium]
MIFRCSGQSGYSAEVSGHPQRVAARKLEREVEARFTDVACVVRTPEGAVHAHPGDAILTGNGGQHWRVSQAKFANKYRPIAPTIAGQAGHYRSLPYHILALQLWEPFDVLLADGVSALSGHAGDWLVDYGDGSLGIVAQNTFTTTYEISR